MITFEYIAEAKVPLQPFETTLMDASKFTAYPKLVRLRELLLSNVSTSVLPNAARAVTLLAGIRPSLGAVTAPLLPLPTGILTGIPTGIVQHMQAADVVAKMLCPWSEIRVDLATLGFPPTYLDLFDDLLSTDSALDRLAVYGVILIIVCQTLTES